MTYTYEPALPSWSHQKRANDLARDREYFAFLMEMGTGKTKVVIDEFCELWERGLIDTVLIFAKKGTYLNWIMNELPTHVPKRVWDDAVIRPWYAGGGNTSQKRELSDLLQRGPWLRILVMNSEAPGASQTAAAYVEAFLYESKSYIVLDESTDTRNIFTKKAENLIRIARRGHYRRIMSGLPNPRSPLDFYGQSEFLQEGLLGQSFYAFRARYARLKEISTGKTNSRGQPIKTTLVVGFQNQDELSDRIGKWSYRVRKDQCLDIPPKQYTKRFVDLTDEQQRVYAELRDFAIADLDGNPAAVSSPAVITRILRLQQVICGHVKTDDGDLVDISSNRVDEVMDILSEIEGKTIIWCRFRPDVAKIVAAIQKAYPDEKVAQFHGGNESTRATEAKMFQEDPECRWIVATYAGGHGNTWTAAEYVIYFSNDFDLEKRMQSEDRAHRGGQKKVVTYIDLIARGTIDEVIVDALREKIDVSSAILKDGYRKWLI